MARHSVRVARGPTFCTTFPPYSEGKAARASEVVGVQDMVSIYGDSEDLRQL